MIRVGIITKIGKNYGAVLQAFALKKACDQIGAESHIIKYTPKESRRSYKICRFSWGVRGTIANIRSLIHLKLINQGTTKFMEFREEYYDFLGEYTNDDQLLNDPPECDVFITGSDQVWNPNISFDKAFYLLFAGEKQRKASYAASVGLSVLPNDVRDEFKRRVEKFDFISVRERSAVRLFQDMGIDATVAPDPTLLFNREEWNEYSIETIKTPYILCYFVSFPSGVREILKEIQAVLNLEIVNLMTSEESSAIGDIKIRNAGPREFLGLFQNANFVLTSSFHGTIFSIINRKPFLTMLYSSTGSRVTDLLEQLNLSERIITTDSSNVSKLVEASVYTEEIDSQLNSIRMKGREILSDIICSINE